MPEFNIDDLKKTWQQEPAAPRYGSTEIEAMLNKSSRNYVKYILGISVAEFFIILCFNLYYLFFGSNSQAFISLLTKIGVKNADALRADFRQIDLGLQTISLLIAAIFVYLFYRNYVQIRVESNLKKLILQIIRFKKTVNRFILANIILMVIYMLFLGGYTYGVLTHQNIEPDHAQLRGLYLYFGLMLVLSVVLIWIYYRLVYGILLRRLGHNLENLRKIENEQI